LESGQGQPAFEGRFGYAGPLSPKAVSPISANGGSAPAAGASDASADVQSSGDQFQSHWLLRTFVPGQIAWDNAVNAFQNGDSTNAGVGLTVMLGEQVLTVVGFQGIQWGIKTGYEYTISNNLRLAAQEPKIPG
jgi:hypothetical protein